MTNFTEIVDALSSKSPNERNRAAIALMDIADSRAIEPLVQAIEKKSNRNCRGSLIYALSAFDCEGRFFQLFTWVLEGGYEASIEALSIIRDQKLKPTVIELKNCKHLMATAVDVDVKLLSELDDLLKLKNG